MEYEFKAGDKVVIKECQEPARSWLIAGEQLILPVGYETIVANPESGNSTIPGLVWIRYEVGESYKYVMINKKNLELKTTAYCSCPITKLMAQGCTCGGV